ncbi:MAG: hypothetical protein F4Y69_04675 [Chloroflexi bacterium]|nr:hypothetical protein [Chloroflexota bacterium]MYF23388.1 hypothetical protein [Chloroflexota bacterium]
MTKVEHLDVSIDVSGVPVEQQALARTSVGQLIDVGAMIAEKEGMRFPLQQILLSDQFEAEVDRLLQPRWGDARFRAVRRHARAIAKTIWVQSEQGDVRFVVVIDALSVSPYRLDNPRFLVTMLHELGHVLREESHLKRLGKQAFTAIPATREQWLSNWAKIIIDEFDVDRLVDTLLRRLATTDGGRPLSLRNVEDAECFDWIGALLDGLGALPRVVDQSVWGYRTRSMQIDELAESVIPEVNGVLTLLSHTAAIYMDTERWPDIATRVAETEASRRFLREHQETILGRLGSRAESLEDAIAAVSEAIEAVFRNCGLRFETVPEGVYIAVDPPAN